MYYLIAPDAKRVLSKGKDLKILEMFAMDATKTETIEDALKSLNAVIVVNVKPTKEE
jgi:hypothetical protein